MTMLNIMYYWLTKHDNNNYHTQPCLSQYILQHFESVLLMINLHV